MSARGTIVRKKQKQVKDKQAYKTKNQTSPIKSKKVKRKSSINLTEPLTKRVTRSSSAKAENSSQNRQQKHTSSSTKVKAEDNIKSENKGFVVKRRQMSSKNVGRQFNVTTGKETYDIHASTKSKKPGRVAISKPKKRRNNTGTSHSKDKNSGSYFINLPLEADSSAPQIKIEQTFNTTLRNLVSHMLSVGENTMWIGRQAFDGFMKVYYNENELTVIKEFKYPEHDFDDMCFDPLTKEILYCDRKNQCIMSVMDDYQLRIFKCVKPMKPACITVSPDDYIYVGLVEAYDYEESPQREIVKFSRDGDVCLRIKGLEGKNVRFAFPHRVVINPANRNIVVAAGLNMQRGYEGQVVNFNSKGKLTFTYRDQRPNVNFKVIGLTCSPKGNIICANECNGDIHILDATGLLLNLVSQSSLGIPGKPWSLSMDRQGHLMIGAMIEPCGMIHIAKYTEQ